MTPASKVPVLLRNSCTECQRRKQKCNREWPCNHCQRRRVVDKCHFGSSASSTEKSSSTGGPKRSQPSEGENGTGDYDGQAIEVVGYMAGSIFAGLGLGVDNLNKAVHVQEDWVTPDESHTMREALAALPPRPKLDSLVQLFFDNVNLHYYIVFPTTFLQEYQEWCKSRVRKQPLSMQWTSLLLAICSCTTQHLDIDEKSQIETDFSEGADILTKRYLNAGRELSNSIPDGHYHLLNVQRLLHSIYWYKAEARFVEAWHLIGAAVREAQELGLHREATSRGLPEFDREMRRRVWCILSTWDWQFASGLGRPTLIDHRDVNIAQPTLTMESYDPSPLLHMKLQAEVVAILASQFGAPRNVETPQQIQQYLKILEAWIRTFPAVYNTENPDYSHDGTNPWAVSHRYYIQTMAYLMVLNPIRTYMAKTYSPLSSPEELRIREIGVHYSLKNLKVAGAWTRHVHHKDGRFHFIIFSLFDTATFLSAAIIKDEDHSLPQRLNIITSIDEAVSLLKGLNNLSKTATMPYRLLNSIVKRMPGSIYHGRRRWAKLEFPASPAPSEQLSPDQSSPEEAPSNRSNLEGGTTYLNGSETTSRSNDYANSDGTICTTSQSKAVSASGTDRALHEQPISTIPADDQMYAGQDGQTWGTDSLLQPSFPPHGEAPPTGTVRYDRLVIIGSHTELQPTAPTATESFHAQPITDTELGDFSCLWDWESLGFDFISSQAGSPPAPEQVRRQGQGHALE